MQGRAEADEARRADEGSFGFQLRLLGAAVCLAMLIHIEKSNGLLGRSLPSCTLRRRLPVRSAGWEGGWSTS